MAGHHHGQPVSRAGLRGRSRDNACPLCLGEASPEFAAVIKKAASAPQVRSMTIDGFKSWLERIDATTSQ